MFKLERLKCDGRAIRSLPPNIRYINCHPLIHMVNSLIVPGPPLNHNAYYPTKNVSTPHSVKAPHPKLPVLREKDLEYFNCYCSVYYLFLPSIELDKGKEITPCYLYFIVCSSQDE